MGALNGCSNFGFFEHCVHHTLQLNSFNMNPNSLIVIIASYSTLTFFLASLLIILALFTDTIAKSIYNGCDWVL